jgi:hypothetical protein
MKSERIPSLTTSVNNGQLLLLKPVDTEPLPLISGLLIRHHGATRYLFLGERLRRELSIMPFWSNPRALSDLIKYFYVV